MLSREQRRTLRLLYGILALGCIAVLFGAPEFVTGLAALPGATYFAIAWYRYISERVAELRALINPA